MKDEILKAALAGGTSTIGRFVRWWLLALAGVAVSFAWGWMHYYDGPLIKAAIAGVGVAVAFSIPAAVVVAIALVAVKL